MASQQKASDAPSNTLTGSDSATVNAPVLNSPIDPQERLESWLYDVYCNDCHDSPAGRCVAPMRPDDFRRKYLACQSEPATPLQRTPESSLSSESGGARLPSGSAFAEIPDTWMQVAMDLMLPAGQPSSSSSGSTDTSTTDDSAFSWGVRSPRAPRSLPELVPELPEIDDISSGYEADVSSLSESFILSANTGSDSSPAQFTPDGSASDLDSEAQHVVDSVNDITRDHFEQMHEIRANAESSQSASSLPTPEATLDPLPAPINTSDAAEVFAQLARQFDRARGFLYGQADMSHSRGEYKAEMARIAALEIERVARLDRERERLCEILYAQARMSHSPGEYKAEIASIKAFDRAHRGGQSPTSSMA